MRHKTVKTKDVRRFQQAIDDLLDRPSGTEGMGVLWGPPGTGKSTSLAYFTNQYDGIFIRALTCSTVTSILGDICTALGWVTTASGSGQRSTFCAGNSNGGRNRPTC